jgi:hypothetical protein
MAQATIATQVHETLDTHGHFPTQITFNRELANFLTEPIHIGVVQILDLRRANDTCRFADFLRASPTNTKNRGESDLSVLVVRNIYPCDPGHVVTLCSNLKKRNAKLYRQSAPESTLTLLMARIGTDDANDALATNDLAMAANSLDRSLNFHGYLLKEYSYLVRNTIRPLDRS